MNEVCRHIFATRYSSGYSYLERKKLTHKVIEQISAELEGRTPGKKYLKLFPHALRSLPLERRKELFWCNLTGPQLVTFASVFPDELKGELLARLEQEFPEKFEAYCKKDYFACRDVEKFKLSRA